jgi:hypothetical protein
VKEKTCLKGLQKFEARINELASKFVSDNNDLENIDIESVGGHTDGRFNLYLFYTVNFSLSLLTMS